MEFTREEYLIIMEWAKAEYFDRAKTEEEKEHAYDIWEKAHDIIKHYKLD